MLTVLLILLVENVTTEPANAETVEENPNEITEGGQGELI